MQSRNKVFACIFPEIKSCNLEENENSMTGAKSKTCFWGKVDFSMTVFDGIQYIDDRYGAIINPTKKLSRNREEYCICNGIRSIILLEGIRINI